MLERYRILLPFCAVQTLCPKTRDREQAKQQVALLNAAFFSVRSFYRNVGSLARVRRVVTFHLLSFCEPLKDVARRDVVHLVQAASASIAPRLA